MTLQPAPYSGETSGASARLADPNAMSEKELGAIASGSKISGGRKRKSSRKARKSGRKARKSARKTARKSRSWFML